MANNFMWSLGESVISEKGFNPKFKWVNGEPKLNFELQESAGSDIKVAVQRFIVDGSVAMGNTQDLTISGLGWTPKAALFFPIHANSTTNPAVHFNTAIGVAADDGGGGIDQWCAFSFSEDNVSTTNCSRNANTGQAIYLSKDGTISGRVFHSVTTFIANGVRIQNDSSSANIDSSVLAIFFGGADLQVKAGTIALGTGTSAIDVTAPGFEPTILFTGGHNDDFGNIVTDFGNISVGVVTNQDATVTQKSINLAYEDLLSTSSTRGRLLTNRGNAQHSVSANSLDYFLTYGSFDSLGFSVTPSASTNNDDIGYLALDTGDRKVFVDVIDSPTNAASDWDVTSIGFKPQTVGMYTSNVQTVDVSADSAEFGVIGVSAFDGTREASVVNHAENGVTTMNTGNQFKDVGLFGLNDAGTTILDAVSPTFEPNGFKFTSANITTADATARKLIVFAIEAQSVVTLETNIFDCKIIIKDSDTDLLDGKLIITENTDTDLFDGKLIIKDSDTDLLDGKLIVKDSDTDLLDGKIIIKDSDTDLFDGKLIVKDSNTDLFDSKIIIKDSDTDLLDGKIIIENTDIDLFDGKINIKNSDTDLLDGKLIVKDSDTDLLDGKINIKDISTDLFDGKVLILSGGDITIIINCIEGEITQNFIEGGVNQNFIEGEINQNFI